MEGYKIIRLKVSMNIMRGIMRVSERMSKQERRSSVANANLSE